MKLFEQFWRLPLSFVLLFLVYGALLAVPAGVLPYSSYQDKYVILLGVDHHRPGFWMDFGGQDDWHETALETAAREFSEETMFSFFAHKSEVRSRLKSVEPIVASNGYHMYPLAVPFIQDLNKVHQGLCAARGASWLGNHHVEKIDYAWVYADDLKKAFVAAGGNASKISLRSIDNRPVKLHVLLAQTLGTVAGQSFLCSL